MVCNELLVWALLTRYDINLADQEQGRNQRILSYTHQVQKKNKFVSKNDKNAIILATFNFLHYTRTVRIGRYITRVLCV